MSFDLSGRISAFFSAVVVVAFISSCTNVRTPAEFEPCSGVLVCWPLNLPKELVKDLSENVTVHVIVQDSCAEKKAKDCFRQLQIENAAFHIIPVESPGFVWLRDCAPVFTLCRGKLFATDFVYNCHRKVDDAVPKRLSRKLGIVYKKSSLVWTGGNFMTDGRGLAVSCDHILKDNGYNEKRVRREALKKLGITDYRFIPDAQGINMNHVDCWAKFLSIDKVLVARVPRYDSRYDDYEAAAQWFSTLETSSGGTFEVFRVDIPAYDTLAPYTNSLILNDHVYVPLGTSEKHNADALKVYRQALPGYTVKGYKSVGGRYWSPVEHVFRSIEWLNSDALHCRTMGIP